MSPGEVRAGGEVTAEAMLGRENQAVVVSRPAFIQYFGFAEVSSPLGVHEIEPPALRGSSRTGTLGGGKRRSIDRAWPQTEELGLIDRIVKPQVAGGIPH